MLLKFPANYLRRWCSHLFVILNGASFRSSCNKKCCLLVKNNWLTWKVPGSSQRENKQILFIIISTWKWKVQIRALACICWSLHKQSSYHNWNYKYHICEILLLPSCSVCNVNACFWNCLGWGASGIFTCCYFPTSVREVISSSGFNTFLPLLNVCINNHQAFWKNSH